MNSPSDYWNYHPFPAHHAQASLKSLIERREAPPATPFSCASRAGLIEVEMSSLRSAPATSFSCASRAGLIEAGDPRSMSAAERREPFPAHHAQASLKPRKGRRANVPRQPPFPAHHAQASLKRRADPADRCERQPRPFPAHHAQASLKRGALNLFVACVAGLFLRITRRPH